MAELTVPDLVPKFYSWLRRRDEAISYGGLRDQIRDFLRQDGWVDKPVIVDHGFFHSIGTIEEVVRRTAREKAEKARIQKRDRAQKLAQKRAEAARQGTLDLPKPKARTNATPSAPE